MVKDDEIIIRYKFKPKTDKAKIAVKEIKEFLRHVEINYEFDGTIPQKGDYVLFSLHHLDISEGYEEEFLKLSDNAKKYFENLCLDNYLKVHRRKFCGAIYLHLLVEEYFNF